MFDRGHKLCCMYESTVNKLILKYCDTCNSTCNDYTCLKIGGVEVVTELDLSQSHEAETLYSRVILQRAYVFRLISASKREIKSNFTRK